MILTDPVGPESGLTAPRGKANVVLVTQAPFPRRSQADRGDGLWIQGSGEYDAQGISIVGFPLASESDQEFLKTVYLLQAFGTTMCFLGHVSRAPEPAILERFTDVDILFLPGGGGPFLDSRAAIELVREIEPAVVIPGFFKIPGLKRPAGEVRPFAEGLDYGKVVPQEKFSIRKKDLADIKAPQVVVLKT